MQLSDLQTSLYQLLREPEGAVYGGLPIGTADFPLVQTAADLSQQQYEFIESTGLAPGLTDKFLVTPVVPTLDFVLPADLASLVRIEYQLPGLQAFPLRQVTFDEFDQLTLGGVATAITGGPARCYRQPFGNTIRLYPTPSAADVAAGNMLAIYYTTLGLALVNPTDVPGIPAAFHMALVYGVLARYWRTKEDDTWSDRYQGDYVRLVGLAKAHYENQNRGAQSSIGDDEDSYFGGSLGTFGV